MFKAEETGFQESKILPFQYEATFLNRSKDVKTKMHQILENKNFQRISNLSFFSNQPSFIGESEVLGVILHLSQLLHLKCFLNCSSKCEGK